MRQTFPGDVRPIDPESFLGANGRFFRPVAAEFDGTHTTVSYERVPMDEMQERYGHLIDAAADAMDVVELFGGAS